MKHIFFLSFFYLVLACNRKKPAIPDITTGLVAEISLDANAIETVTNTPGTINGAIPTSNRKGELNKAMLFNGMDSNYIDFGPISNVSFPESKFSFSCWIKVTNNINILAILSKRSPIGPYEYSIDNHFDRQGFTFDNWIADGSKTVYGIDPLQAKAPFDLNNWHHLVFVTNDNNNLVVYVDGKIQPGIDSRQKVNSNIQIIEPSNCYNFSATSAHFILGNGGAYGNQYYFTGAIDDIKVYNRALDEISVKELYMQ